MKSKVISIILISIFSILLWGYISLSGEFRTTLVPNVEISNIPEEYDVSSVSATDVTIRIKGNGWDLAKLVWGPRFNYDVSAKNDSGKHEVIMMDELDRNSRLPSSIQVIEMLPGKINFSIDKIKSKRIPIVANVVNKFKVGYGIVSDIKIIPDSVTVSGTKSQLEGLINVNTITKEYDGLDKSVYEFMELENKNNLNYSLDKVLIQYDVEKIVDLTFKDISVETRGVPYFQYLQLYPSKIDVVVRGGINQLSNLEKSNITAYINYRQAIEDSIGAIKPHVKYPSFTRVIKTEPNKLKYIIKKKN